MTSRQTKTHDRILLAHGSGGRLTQELVRDVFLPALENPYLRLLSDAAILPEMPPGTRPALTTDAFVVDPPIFPGGDVGYLSVCGTVNDLAVAGAQPLYLTWALILEEGAAVDLISTCAAGAARAASEAGVQVVAGDTKVVHRGKGDRIYAITAGLGAVPSDAVPGDARIEVGDAVLVTGPVGDHGATIMACRHNLKSDKLTSDCAPLGPMLRDLLAQDVEIHAMHDPTRGGLVATCNEVAVRAGVRMLLDEEGIPVRGEVRTVCDLLGLEPWALPCEGRALIWLPKADAQTALDWLETHPLGRGAALIGEVFPPAHGHAQVELRNSFGAERPLDLLSGMDLPRIC